jgi:multidrug efflux system membrane fusion protein
MRRSIAACAALIASCCALSGCQDDGKANGKRGQAKIPVITAKAEERELPFKLTALGTVESTGTVALQPRVDGQVVKVFVRDGQEVKIGQPLMQIDPVPFQLQLRMAEATLARDKAKLENAHAKADRGKSLFDQHYLSNDEYTQLRTDLDGAQATVDQDRAAVDNARVQLGYATITAPVAGKIGHIAQQVGNTLHVASATPITTLNVLDTVDVTFALPEQQINAIRGALAQGAAKVEVNPAANSEGQAKLAGTVSFVDNTVDVTTGTIKLHARFDNRSRALWPGQFVTVNVNLPASGKSTVIPAVAISEGPKGPYIYVVQNGGIAEQRPVQVLRTSEAHAIVTGVNVGEEIVIDGQSRLTPNAPVDVHPHPETT